MVRVLFDDGSCHGALALGITRRPLVVLALLMLAGITAAASSSSWGSTSAFQPSGASSSSGRNVLVATRPPGGGQASWSSQLPKSSSNNGYQDGPRSSSTRRSRMSLSPLFASAKKSTVFELRIDLPPSNSDVQAVMGIDPILSVPSELVVVRYRVPFGLNVEPRKNLAVVTKAGPGGEQPGDVLRYCSQWTLGLPKGDGLVTTAAAFSGGLSWQCSMFNVVKAKAWEQVVQALTSNTETRTDEMVMIFERALDGVTPPELQ